MATYAKILKDASGNQILPYTRSNLVYNGSTPISTYLNSTLNNRTSAKDSSGNTYFYIKNMSLVPASNSSNYKYYLRGDGTWSSLEVPNVVGISKDSSSSTGYKAGTAGLVPAPSGTNPDTTGPLYLCNFGSWTYLEKKAIVNGLGFTPANEVTAKYLYHYNLSVDNWSDASSLTSVSGFSYYQIAGCYIDNGGPKDISSAKISTPMTIKTNSAITNATLQSNLNIIADGYITGSSTGQIHIYVKEKPSSDITIYLEMQF